MSMEENFHYSIQWQSECSTRILDKWTIDSYIATISDIQCNNPNMQRTYHAKRQRHDALPRSLNPVRHREGKRDQPEAPCHQKSKVVSIALLIALHEIE